MMASVTSTKTFTRRKEILTALIAIDGIGRKTVFNLLAKLKQEKTTLVDFWQSQDQNLWQNLGLNSKQRTLLREWQQINKPETYFGSLIAQKIKVVTIEEKNYPELLKETADPPFLLFVKGPLESLKRPSLAIVGTRQISGYGRLVCERFVPFLVKQKINIVSGFMYGVDVTAQKLAHVHSNTNSNINSNTNSSTTHHGTTTGVLGFGFNHMYPRHQRRLFQEMLAAGQTFITEYPPHIKPTAGLFPERNRIVAGLVKAVLVVEAGKKSGSHITARLAGEENRDLYAVPGPITNPFSEGTKWLINQGATLVTSPEEILKKSNFKQQKTSQQQNSDSPNFDNQKQAQIYRHLLEMPATTEDLITTSKLPSAIVNTHLSLLELKGLIRREGSRWFVVSKFVVSKFAISKNHVQLDNLN